MENIMLDKIRSSCQYVAYNSQYVKINYDKLDKFISNIDCSNLKNWLMYNPYDLLNLDVETIINFLLIFESIDYSFWGQPKWMIDTEEGIKDGSDALLYVMLKYVNKTKNTDFTKLLDENHIPWTNTPSGQFFAQRAQDIVTLLVRRAQQANTDFWLNTQALHILPARQGLYTVQTSRGSVQARHIVLAAGGLSFPALGASSFGLNAARQLGLSVVETQPALVGLSFPTEWKTRCAPLTGNSLPVQISCDKFSYTGPLLFTHEGISGPAVLQASLFWKEGEKVTINFLPDTDVLAFLRRNKQSPALFSALLADKIPAKISKALLGNYNVPAANATTAELQQAAQNLNHFSFVPKGTAGWTKAEVTKGGVDCREINPSTMQCRRFAGLFIIGELLDVTGMVGGYNLQWAWSSGWAAAKALEQFI